MKHIISVLTKIAVCSLSVACLISCSRGGQDVTKPWGTGSVTLDKMLDRVDSVEMVAFYDETVVKHALHSVDSFALMHDDKPIIKAAGLFA